MDMDKFLIRPVASSDASQFLLLWDALDTETEFMLFAPGERQVTLEQQTEQLSRTVESEYAGVYVLENTVASEISGFVACRQNSRQRDQHSAYLVIGIKQEHTGKGWGRKLLEEAECWAKGRGLHRLDLSVMSNNHVAIGLYKSLGFKIEGTKRDAVKLESGYFDEHMMGKLL